jgi:hypothetical protein
MDASQIDETSAGSSNPVPGPPHVPTLGEIEVSAFNQDVVVNERHQTFAAELLRIALLGLGGIGYIISKLPDTNHKVHTSAPFLKALILSSALAFGISAGAALALRYLSSDVLSYQLRIVRLRSRGSEGDSEAAHLEEAHRDRRLKLTRPLLLTASAALAAGACVFVGYLFIVIGA